MENYITQLVYKPVTTLNQGNVKHKVIKITDLTLHTSDKRATTSIGRKLAQVVKTGIQDRSYSQAVSPYSEDQKITILKSITSDPDFINLVQEEEKNGYKILIEFPAEGVPILIGKDTEEYVQGIQGKRVLRRFVKEGLIEN